METQRLHISKTGDLDVEFVEGEALERFDALAREAIEEARKHITMALRYLNTALWHLPPERALLIRPVATNGRVLRYSPERVVLRYQQAESELVRDVLHAVLHCTLHHPFEKRHGEYAAWSLASDVTVELCAIDLCGERYPSELDAKRLEAGRRLATQARNLTAPALYQLFRCGAPGEALYRANGFTERDLEMLAELFRRDAHDLWATHPGLDDMHPQAKGALQPLPDLQAAARETGKGKAETDEGGGGHAGQESGEGGSGRPRGASELGIDENPDKPDAEEPEAGEDAGEQDADERGDSVADEGAANLPDAPNADDVADDQTAQEWERIGKRVEAELRAQRQSLSGEGGLLQNLAVANRKPANYDEFLRRFATMAEDMRISDEEFDYVYYTYGLSRYGNVPLVEPLEYQERNRLREFVIAIDTSGSCAGELVRTFVQRTFDILRQQTSFGDRMNVHLVQCDNRVRTATKVTSLLQLESYADEFWVSGGGGTDFKPVFEYVDSLLDAGEFDDLRGLIYFTDGYGAFPTRAPDYEVAFVFVDDDDATRRVPAWACKVTMTQDEVLQR